MAFSQGAGLAASLLVRKMQQDPVRQRLYPLFRCGVFFSGGVPEDPAGISRKERRLLSYKHDGEVIDIPTAHIWGENDQLYPSFGPVLSQLCKKDLRADFVHQGGHEVPGSKSSDAVANTIRAIKRTIERALTAQ